MHPRASSPTDIYWDTVAAPNLTSVQVRVYELTPYVFGPYTHTDVRLEAVVVSQLTSMGKH